MKKFFISLIALLGVSGVQAENDYTYLTFETTEGAKVSVAVEALKITVSGTTLTAGSKTFTLSNLAKMYFSTTDESMITGIGTMTDAVLDDAVEVYDLNGRRVSPSPTLPVGARGGQWKMPRGAYIVKTKDRTYKMVVK